MMRALMNVRLYETRFHARDRVYTKHRTQVVDSREGPAVLTTDKSACVRPFVWR